MKKRKFPSIATIVSIVTFAGLALFIAPVFLLRGGHGGGRSICQSNLKQIGISYQQYIQDYNETLPPISAGGRGWGELLQPYLKSEAVFRCPEAEVGQRSLASNDYFYNARLAGRSQASFASVSQTILNGDGVADADYAANITELPAGWKHEGGPSRRHLDGANYAFADGHVKWLRAEKLSTDSTEHGGFTFSPD